MNRIIISLLVIFTTANVCYSQCDINDAKRVRLSGIKSQRVFVTKYENDKPSGDSVLSQLTEYDRNGLSTKLYYYRESKLMWTQFSYYASGGGVDSLVSTLYNPVTNEIQTVLKTRFAGKEYSYHHFEIIPDSTIPIEAEFDTTHYEYDDRGNNITITTKMGNSKLLKRARQVFDSSGNMIEQSTDFGDVAISVKNVYKYNSNGFRIEMDTFDQSSKLLKKFIYNNDSSGNAQEYEEYFGADTLINKYTVYYEYY